jgi:DNA-binding NarL/FixJ family response regulator
VQNAKSSPPNTKASKNLASAESPTASGDLLQEELLPPRQKFAELTTERRQARRPRRLYVEQKGKDEREQLCLLTWREREVHQLLAFAKTNKEIANALGIEVRTARFHVSNILHKLGKTRRIELLAKDWPQSQ